MNNDGMNIAVLRFNICESSCESTEPVYNGCIRMHLGHGSMFEARVDSGSNMRVGSSLFLGHVWLPRCLAPLIRRSSGYPCIGMSKFIIY